MRAVVHLYIPGQKNYLLILSNVLPTPMCPEIGCECANSKNFRNSKIGSQVFVSWSVGFVWFTVDK